MKQSRTNLPLFYKHLDLFMESMQLLSPKKSVIVAVSGGVDSIGLMYALHKICHGNIKVLHINHGTRPENAFEENLVVEHAQKLAVEIDIVRFKLSLSQSNFESVARNLRAEVYKQYIQKNYWVYTAHHLDDSFEWSMIQSFKQSSVDSTLGIPVFNRGLVRPFMCVSKNQIINYAKTLGLNWIEDSSQRDMRFERNFFRIHLTKTIHERYPQYLRHYVARQNELALKLHLHRSHFLKNKNQRKAEFLEKREVSGAVVIRCSDLSLYKNEIKEWIHFFSKSHRGEINREVDKLISSHLKMLGLEKELKMKGPISFSGGVKIFILEDYLLVTNDLNLEYYKKCDDELVNFFNRTNDTAQITFIIHSHYLNSNKATPKNRFYPYLCLLDKKHYKKSSKLIHPLLPKATSWLKENKIPYSFYPLLQKKKRISERQSAVILDSSVLGL